MKILEVINFLSSGGAERFVVDLSNELSKNNEVHLLTILNDDIDSEVRSFYKFAIDDKVHYSNLKLPNGLKRKSQIAVKDAIKKINPDVIHIHLIPTLKYSAWAVLSLVWKYKVYFTVHTDLKNGYDKGFFKLIVNALGKYGRFRLICISERNYKDFASFYRNAKIECIVNGRAPIMPTDKFDEVTDEIRKYRADDNSLIFLHVARRHPVKNQDLLIDAFNELITEGYNISLVIIGSGFDSNEGLRLKAKANKRIHFLGTRKNISDYMLNADAFCLSSDFEGMPITLLEASLAGIPSVSTPVCGAVDIIDDGINGCLSKGHALDQYKEAIRSLVHNYQILKKNALSMNGMRNYTINECAKKYLEYFNK